MGKSDREQGAAFSFDHLSLLAQFKFFAAIFMIFAPTAAIISSGMASSWPMPVLFAWLGGSGLIAVGWALAFTKNKWWLVVVIPGQIVVGMGLGRLLTQSDADLTVVTVAGLISVAFIVGGYIFFISFINSEGAKSLRLQTEIGLAQQIHNHLVPTIELTTERLEIYGEAVASSEVGGDLVDVIEQDDQVGIYVADVSGHGVKAGVFMSMVKSSIRTELIHASPLNVLCQNLNRVLYEVKQADMFVTFAALRMDDQRNVEFALAGHPSILHYQKSTDRIVELENGHPPLGVLDELKFDKRSLTAEPGDVFVIITDGLIELDGEWDVKVGMNRLKGLMLASIKLPTAELHAHIMKTIRDMAPVDDDQTLLVARVR